MVRRKRMNRKIMEAAGHEEKVILVDGGKCPFCKKTVDLKEIRDADSLKEYHISGLCQSCQDAIFGK
jgi:hypothetical protein